MRSAKERGPEGRPRWKKSLRTTPWSPRVYARRTCSLCARDLRRGHYIMVPECVVGGRHLPYGGLLCLQHTDVHLVAPCSCGTKLYRQSGAQLRRQRVVHAVEWVTQTGQVIRDCPGCGEALDTTLPETTQDAPDST